jgi:hypothetical protein
MLVKVAPLLEMVDDWAGGLKAEIDDKRLKEIQGYEGVFRIETNII